MKETVESVDILSFVYYAWFSMLKNFHLALLVFLFPNLLFVGRCIQVGGLKKERMAGKKEVEDFHPNGEGF